MSYLAVSVSRSPHRNRGFRADAPARLTEARWRRSLTAPRAVLEIPGPSWRRNCRERSRTWTELAAATSVVGGCSGWLPGQLGGARRADARSGGGTLVRSAVAFQPVAAGAARRVDPSQFLPQSQLLVWQQQLDRIGLRATASPVHEQFIDQPARSPRARRRRGVGLEPVPLERWTTEAWALRVLSGPSAGELKTASYIPYSGRTPGGRREGSAMRVRA